jgi:YD repeat-containing protein
MFKKLILFAFIVIIIQFLAAPKAGAQTANPCVAPTIWFTPYPIPFGFWYYGRGEGPFSIEIATYNNNCHPPPECPCSAKADSPVASLPIYLATGDTFIQETDVSLPGLGGGLTLQRTWNSLWPPNEVASSVGLFGPNWRSTYEERIFMGGDNYLKYARSDGGYWSFGAGSGNFVVVSPANVAATLSQPSYTLLKFQNGEQRRFDQTTGLLTTIIDRNGNTTQLTYDSSNRLIAVTDPASRHLYFNYANGSSYLVTSVTSDFGVSFSYSYDASGRLSQVTKPDSTTITYTYNSQSQITQVTDSNGKVLESHTYDSTGRGLSSSQANGVNSLTLTYLQ